MNALNGNPCVLGEADVDGDCYAYMFKAGERRLLFVRNFGTGTESVAQVVKDLNSGTNLIRKVGTSRLLQKHSYDKKWRPQKPHEIQILNTIRETFKDPEEDLPYYIAECYGHEYIKSKDKGIEGQPKYSSVSYWKLYNGGSVYTRYLAKVTGNNPPVVILARMIRQILSTLHYLYTAGEQPIFHGDFHLGNVWAHWSPASHLPDFYLGDFSQAGFEAPKGGFEKTTDTAIQDRPIDDLHRLTNNLDVLLDKALGARQDTRASLLREVNNYIKDVVNAWRDRAVKTTNPPDLRRLIEEARRVEDICNEGGMWDETRSDDYISFVSRERREAYMVEHERSFVVRATKSEALCPHDPESTLPVPVALAIHGPWYLVRLSWVPAEGDDVTHHRPNGGPQASSDSKKLSLTDRTLAFFHNEWIGSEPGSSKDENPAAKLFFANGPLPGAPTAATESSEPNERAMAGSAGGGIPAASQQQFSWRPGDDHDFSRISSSGSYVSAQDGLEGLPNRDPGDNQLAQQEAGLDARLADWEQTYHSSARPGETAQNQNPQAPPTPANSSTSPTDVRIARLHMLFHGGLCRCNTDEWLSEIETRVVETKLRGALRQLRTGAGDADASDSSSIE
ncbi:hypothetical protein VTK56DRAFT_9382 [Thermocarpiscus australiensis]